MESDIKWREVSLFNLLNQLIFVNLFACIFIFDSSSLKGLKSEKEQILLDRESSISFNFPKRRIDLLITCYLNFFSIVGKVNALKLSKLIQIYSDGVLEIKVFKNLINLNVSELQTGIEYHLQVRIKKSLDFHFLEKRGVPEKQWDPFNYRYSAAAR